MRESKVETDLVDAAAKEGWSSFKLSKSETRGRPDRWFYRNPAIVKPIEIKAPGERPTRQQLKRIEELRANGFDADWCDNVEDGLAILRR